MLIRMGLGMTVAAWAFCARTASADDLDLVAAGAAASQRGDHVAAAHLYLDSYARTLDPATLVLIGTEYVRAGKPREAVRFFCRYPGGSEDLYVAAQLGALHDTATCDERAPAPRDRLRYAPVALAAIGVAALGGGFYEQHRASVVSDQIGGHPPNVPWPDDIRALEARGQRAETTGYVLWGVGAAALVGSGVVYALTHRHERLAVVPAGRGVGVSLVFNSP